MNITIAIHEASHAVVAVRTVGSHGLAKNSVVTIERKGSTLGSIVPKNHGNGVRGKERGIIILLAGGIGEGRISPQEVAGGIGRDVLSIMYRLDDCFRKDGSMPFRDAAIVLSNEVGGVLHEVYHRAMRKHVAEWKPDRAVPAKMLAIDVATAVRELCISGNGAKAVQRLIVQPRIWESEWFRLLGRLTNRTSELLDQHWNDVHRLANQLLKVGTMAGPDAEAFIRAEKAKVQP